MGMKSDRQQMILRIILYAEVHNQEELQALLQEQGMNVTQATLSRDVNELGLVKYRNSDGTLCYRRKAVEAYAPNTAADGIVSAEVTVGSIVIKTHPGFASVVATTIDRSQMSGVAGTIAGDDTILVIVRVKTEPESLIPALESILPGIENKFC